MVSDQFLLIFSNATQFVQELHEGCVFRFFCHMLSKQFGANLPERNSSVFTPFEIFTPSPSIWLFSPSPSIWRFVNTELNRRLESVRGNQIDQLPIHSLLPIHSFNFSSRLWSFGEKFETFQSMFSRAPAQMCGSDDPDLDLPPSLFSILTPSQLILRQVSDSSLVNSLLLNRLLLLPPP